jgi:two-component system chemotaxis sensor kinase CheA
MDDLISEFITETSESLAVLDLELVKLEQNPNDKNILGNIFRLVHTIKGTCGFLGLPRLESVAHAGENVLGKIRDGDIPVTEEAITIVLEALDCIKDLVGYLAENGAEKDGDDNDLKKRLNHFADTNGAIGSGAAAAPVAAASVEATALEEMLAPDEVIEASSYATMDELERAFANASSTIEGGMDFTKAPTHLLVADDSLSAAPAPTSAPAASAPLSDKTKEKAIKQGLDTETKDAGAGLANQSIRVSIDVLENLMQMVGELVLTRNQLMQVVRHRDDRELKGPLQHLSQITSELQEGVMKTRMQPIGNAWSKFPRLIRDLSNDLHKKIDLKMIGESTELDRQLLEMIKDPLTHMVRNSCDHGIEMPAERLAAGKPETGSVTLSAYHEGGHIMIKITDDGKGLAIDRIKQKIIEKELATPSELDSMSDETIMQFIFKAGFSTAEKVTSVSGRGVGMDVVRTNIEKIGGTVSLSSTVGKGSTFHIKIPLTLAIVSVLLVETADQKFAVPQINVVELVRVGLDSDYVVETLNQSKVLRLRDRLLPLLSLRDVLHLPAQEGDEAYIVVLRIGSTDFGLVVDKIHDTEEIVVKPVAKVLGELDVYSGNTILGDGSVIMILDPGGLARAVGELDTGAEAGDVVAGTDEKMTNFLVFNAGDGAPKAVPLELVARLEEINAADIEHSGHDRVVQYRGDLMRLTLLPGCAMPARDTFDVIVFNYDSKTIGLIVDAIVDIERAPLAIKMTGHDEQYLGSNVIKGKTTDIVDVGYLLKDFVGELASAGKASAQANGVHVLFVEDSLFFRKLTAPFLSNVGYHVTAAEGPNEALAMVDRGMKFDAIVTDIEMPDMDGFDLAIALRQQYGLQGIPIVAFTSTVNEIFRERARRSGINAMILKTDRAALLVALAEQLSLKEAA